jgi:iron-sulfur cluster repair protein YtfE (RIC family)
MAPHQIDKERTMSRNAASETPNTLHNARPALVVHGALRRELGLAGPLVRRVAEGDADRAAVVARHLDLVLRMLHHHHETEDEGVWPRLRDRAGEEVVALVEVMERQHARIDELTCACEELLPVWARAASGAVGERLATSLEELQVVLGEHLELEERELLGLAEQHLTHDEWEAMGASAQAAFPGKERTLVFGLLEHRADPEIIAQMLASAPAPVRFLVPRLGRRAYRRQAVAVHGTPNP